MMASIGLEITSENVSILAGCDETHEAILAVFWFKFRGTVGLARLLTAGKVGRQDNLYGSNVRYFMDCTVSIFWKMMLYGLLYHM